MAGPKKKPRKPEVIPSDDDSMSDESESALYNGEILATFEGRNLEGQDFHGIKQLLQQLFLKSHIDLGQMTDLMIAQAGIGSVLKQGYTDSDDEEDMEMTDESDVFGVTTVLNLSSHKTSRCVKQFYSLLDEFTSKYADADTATGIKALLEECNKLGFLINERFVNIPAKISPSMLNSLYDELEKMKKKDKSYEFDYMLLISKTCRPKEDEGGEEVFANDEEELFKNAADFTFDFSVENDADVAISGQWTSEDKQLIPHRRVTIFKNSKLKNIIEEIIAFVQ